MGGSGTGLSGGTVCGVAGVHAVAALVVAVHHSDRLRSRGGDDRNNIMQMPMISVITPSRNSGAFLEDAILSVAHPFLLRHAQNGVFQKRAAVSRRGDYRNHWHLHDVVPVIATARTKAIRVVDCNDECGHGVNPSDTTNCAAR